VTCGAGRQRRAVRALPGAQGSSRLVRGDVPGHQWLCPRPMPGAGQSFRAVRGRAARRGPACSPPDAAEPGRAAGQRRGARPVIGCGYSYLMLRRIRGSAIPGPAGPHRAGAARPGHPLPPAVGRVIDQATGGRPGGPILLNSRGHRMDRHVATRRLRRLAETAGVRIARPHPHMLRHTFVTTMLDAGVDLRDVQIAARHADPRTTMRYDRPVRTLTAIRTTSWPPTWPLAPDPSQASCGSGQGRHPALPMSECGE
jgi:hypothetical protein